MAFTSNQRRTDAGRSRFDRATAATAALVFALISVSGCALAQGAPRSVAPRAEHQETFVVSFSPLGMISLSQRSSLKRQILAEFLPVTQKATAGLRLGERSRIQLL